MTDTNKNEKKEDLFETESDSDSKSKTDDNSETESEEEDSDNDSESEEDSDKDSEKKEKEDENLDEESEKSPPSIEDLANKAIVDEDGNIKFAKGTPEETKEAIRLYKKHEALEAKRIIQRFL